MHTHTHTGTSQPTNQPINLLSNLLSSKHGKDTLLSSSFFKSHLLLVNNSLTWFLFNCSLSLSFLSTSQNTDSVISFSQNTTTATHWFLLHLSGRRSAQYILFADLNNHNHNSLSLNTLPNHTDTHLLFPSLPPNRIVLLLRIYYYYNYYYCSGWKDIFKCCSSNQQIQQRLNTHTHNSHKSVVVFLLLVVVFRSWAVSGRALFLLSSSSSSPLSFVHTLLLCSVLYNL